MFPRQRRMELHNDNNNVISISSYISSCGGQGRKKQTVALRATKCLKTSLKMNPPIIFNIIINPQSHTLILGLSTLVYTIIVICSNVTCIW